MRNRRIARLVPLIVGIHLAALSTAQLRTTPLEDGTGTIGLPAGWTVRGSYRGQVSANALSGDTVVLGMPWTILDPSSSVGRLPGGAQTAAARPGDLVGALRSVLLHNGGARLTSVRSRPAQGLNGAPAAFMMYEFTQDGKAFSAIGYFAALVDTDSPGWQLYTSAVLAPKARFVKQLPTLMAVWKSWHPNGQNPVEGSHSDEMDKILEKHRASYDEIQRQFRIQL